MELTSLSAQISKSHPHCVKSARHMTSKPVFLLHFNFFTKFQSCVWKKKNNVN